MNKNKKVRQQKLAHRKTQTPIVAKQVEIVQGSFVSSHPLHRICIFTEIQK